jgi:hypothetical protein
MLCREVTVQGAKDAETKHAVENVRLSMQLEDWSKLLEHAVATPDKSSGAGLARRHIDSYDSQKEKLFQFNLVIQS